MSTNEVNQQEVVFEIGKVDYNKPYNEQANCNRHVVGAYANLAMHNMTTVINFIFQSVGLGIVEEEYIDTKAFNSANKKKLDNNNKLRVQQKLYQHFPFLKRMKLEDSVDKTVHFDTLWDVMSRYTALMKIIRNEYSHYCPYCDAEKRNWINDIKKMIARDLDKLFDDSSRIYRKDEKLTYAEHEVFQSQRNNGEWCERHIILPSNNFDDWYKKLDGQHKLSKGIIEWTDGKGNTGRYKLVDENGEKRIIILDVSHTKGTKDFNDWEQFFVAENEVKPNLVVKDRKYYRKNESGTRITCLGVEFLPPKKYDELLKKIKEQKEKDGSNYKKDKKEYCLLTYKGGDCVFLREKLYERNEKYIARMYSDAEEGGLTGAGVVYFLCCFLEKQTAFEFMDEVGFIEKCSFKDKEGEVTHLKELMCMNRIRMTRSRIDSKMTDMALALDMMSELRKCPKPLFDVLGEEARQTFKDVSTVEWEDKNKKEANPNGENQEQNNLTDLRQKAVPRSTFVRWDDRFPQMALRYIDRKGIFQDIRFQLRLGKYRFAFYTHNEKESIDGNTERVRVLQKEMHGFGRIDEVEEAMKENYKGLFEENQTTQKEKDEVGRKPYITNQKPQYHIDEKSHSIGLRWEEWDSLKKAEKAKAETADEKRLISQRHFKGNDKNMFIPWIPLEPKKESTDGRETNQAEKLLMPQCYLNVGELPSLLFYDHLLKKYNVATDDKETVKTEQVIKDYYSRLYGFLNALANPQEGIDVDFNKLLETYNLHETDIPVKIRDLFRGKGGEEEELQILKENYLYNSDNKKTYIQKLQDRVDRKIKRYESACERIGGDDDKISRKRATIIPGHLAREIMEDITMWLKCDSKCKKSLTGEKYNVIQQAIAMLGQGFEDEEGNVQMVTLDEVSQLMNKIGILDGHAFLPDVINKKAVTTGEFYKNYFEKERIYLKELEEYFNGNEFPKGKDNILKKIDDNLPFLHIKRSRWAVRDMGKLQEHAQQYIDKPIQLPLGLFAQPIFDLLYQLAEEKGWNDLKSELDDIKEKIKAAQSNEAAQQENAQPNNKYKLSTHLLIEKYHKLVEKDDFQEYYVDEKYGRDYDSLLRFYPNTGNKLFFKGILNKLRNKQNLDKDITKYILRTSEVVSRIVNVDDNKESGYIIDRLVGIIVRELAEQVSRNASNTNAKPMSIHQLKINDGNADAIVEKIKKENLKGCSLNQVNSKDLKNEVMGVPNQICKIRKQLHKIEENEHEIRRYQIEDIVMLYMAREILAEKNNRDEAFLKGFHLKNVKKGDELLDKTVDFSWEVTMKNSEGEDVTKRIEQKGMKMKDYGKFYKFASEKERLTTLLVHLAGATFSRAEIENEFAYFDVNRSKVFRYVYLLESMAYKMSKCRSKEPIDLMDDESASEDGFWYVDNSTIKNWMDKICEKIAKIEKKKDEIVSISENGNEITIACKGKDNKIKISEKEKGIIELAGGCIKTEGSNITIEGKECLKEVSALFGQRAEKPKEEQETKMNVWRDYFVKERIDAKAKRDNFGQLLIILMAGDDAKLDEEEKSLLQNIRNAFGHNHYLQYESDYAAVFKGKKDKDKLPEVANTIYARIEEGYENIKKEYDKVVKRNAQAVQQPV